MKVQLINVPNQKQWMVCVGELRMHTKGEWTKMIPTKPQEAHARRPRASWGFMGISLVLFTPGGHSLFLFHHSNEYRYDNFKNEVIQHQQAKHVNLYPLARGS